MKKITVTAAAFLAALLSFGARAGWADDTVAASSASVAAASDSSEPARRAPPSPIDSIFPNTEFFGPTIGVPDTSPVYPLEKLLWDASPFLKDNRIKIYGWLNAGYNDSSSKQNNSPLSYDVVPNAIELDQAVLRIERDPDTVQTDHMDWGFRLSNLYGEDYRFTTGQGYFSYQLLHYNQLYGYDPVEAYAQLYVPKVADGMVLTFGRYISPPDIEAQLSPQNYLFTHSIMFTFDAYTQTGVNSQIKFNDRWSALVGVFAGDDIAPWDSAAEVTGQAMIRWVSPNNKDSIWAGIDSISAGKFKDDHDNLQENNVTYTHVFNKNIHTTTEMYFMYEHDGVLGGTCNFGPTVSYASGGGCGAPIPGLSTVWGLVNYTEWKVSDKDFLSIRNDWMDDVNGERSGFATNYESWTVGVTHWLTSLTEIRPEFRYELSLNKGVTPYDNGTQRDQRTFGIDIIQWF
jgi:hypothetical protein